MRDHNLGIFRGILFPVTTTLTGEHGIRNRPSSGSNSALQVGPGSGWRSKTRSTALGAFHKIDETAIQFIFVFMGIGCYAHRQDCRTSRGRLLPAQKFEDNDSPTPRKVTKKRVINKSTSPCHSVDATLKKAHAKVCPVTVEALLLNHSRDRP